MIGRAQVPEYARQARNRRPVPARPAPVALVTPELAAALGAQDPSDVVLEVLRVRPATLTQLAILTGRSRRYVARSIREHDRAGRVRVVDRIQLGRGGTLSAVWAANW